LSLTITPAAPVAGQLAEVTLVLQNQGQASVTNEFWIDFYVDPVTPPQVNQPWQELCPPDRPLAECQGGTWLVDVPIAPGETVTLSADQFVPHYSLWGGGFKASGAHTLYVYVDSWNKPSSTAAVHESNEGNNRLGPVTVQVGDSDQLRFDLSDWLRLLMLQSR